MPARRLLQTMTPFHSFFVNHCIVSLAGLHVSSQGAASKYTHFAYDQSWSADRSNIVPPLHAYHICFRFKWAKPWLGAIKSTWQLPMHRDLMVCTPTLVILPLLEVMDAPLGNVERRIMEYNMRRYDSSFFSLHCCSCCHPTSPFAFVHKVIYFWHSRCSCKWSEPESIIQAHA